MGSDREKEVLENTVAILRDALSPRRILLFGSRVGKRYSPGADFGQGWITDEDAFLDMLEDRNKASHIYSREESQRIFDRVKQQHLLQIEALARRLEGLQS